MYGAIIQRVIYDNSCIKLRSQIAYLMKKKHFYCVSLKNITNFDKSFLYGYIFWRNLIWKSNMVVLSCDNFPTSNQFRLRTFLGIQCKSGFSFWQYDPISDPMSPCYQGTPFSSFFPLPLLRPGNHIVIVYPSYNMRYVRTKRDKFVGSYRITRVGSRKVRAHDGWLEIR